LQATVDAANVILDDPWNMTQAEVDAAYLAVSNALALLEHDHPVLEHSANYQPITDTSAGLAIKIKGEFTTISSVQIDGDTVILTRTSANSHDIIHGAVPAGTLTKGSAIVTLSPDYLNTLTNGTHTVTVNFSDPHATGFGRSTFEINRSGDELSGNTIGGGTGHIIGTGDDMNLALWLILAIMALITLMVAIRQRRKQR
jgi:hypothetical protein